MYGANKLSVFLSKNKAWCKPGEERTHLLLTNGCFNVRPDINDAFLDAYSEDVASKKAVWCISEQRTPVYKMHLDLDYVSDSDEKIDTEDVSVMLLAVSSSYSRDTPLSTFECVITSAPLKHYEKDGLKRVKLGIHLVFKRLFVTSGTGSALVRVVRDALTKTRGPRGYPKNPWCEVVDEATHTTAGLRMVYSDKAVAGKDGVKVLEGRIHTPMFTATLLPDQKIQIRPWCDTISRAIRYTSIRAWQSPTGNLLIDPGTVPIRPLKRKSELVLKRSTGGCSYPIQAKLRETVEYADIVVTRITDSGDGCRFINVTGPGSKYCGNRHGGSEHGSASIYFIEFPDGVLKQRCYSKKYGCNKYSRTLGKESGLLFITSFGK
jgi:hypothetical protein